MATSSDSVERGEWVRAAVAITATYVAFLLCAQFGFLEQVQAASKGDPARVRNILAVMGLAGLAAGFGAAVVGRGMSPSRAVRAGLIATAIACALSSLARHPLALSVAAGLLGGSLGWLTVVLAGNLDQFVPRRRWGSVAGWGTGAAYLFSNLPPLFDSSPTRRALAGAVACAVAALWAPRDVFTTSEFAQDRRSAGSSPRAPAPATLKLLPLVAAFTGLVVVDSAFFAHLQKSPELLARTWGSPALSLRQGLAHLLVAGLSGWWLDRRKPARLLFTVGVVFALALPALVDGQVGAAAAAVLYAGGISAYSAALVAAPALIGGGRAGTLRGAAVLYGVAGWMGSAFGVGAAEHGRLRLAGMTGLVAFGLAAAFALASWWRDRNFEQRVAVPWSTLVTAAVGVGIAFAIDARVPAPASAGSSSVGLGRAVYLAEGCQHCHSQYVRLATHDEIWWGPARALDRGQRPPTPGNRRIGPDLTNVGIRRNATWQEIHLRSPRTLSPRSRMPSYAHLFGDARGPALVSYLGSLGLDASREREAQLDAVVGPTTPGSSLRGRRLFALHCAACHGEAGRGDGSAAVTFVRPAMDLTLGLPLLGPRDPEFEARLARAIRFGLPTAWMPGHEWLKDAEVADLAAYVLELGPKTERPARRRNPEQ